MKYRKKHANLQRVTREGWNFRPSFLGAFSKTADACNAIMSPIRGHWQTIPFRSKLPRSDLNQTIHDMVFFSVRSAINGRPTISNLLSSIHTISRRTNYWKRLFQLYFLISFPLTWIGYFKFYFFHLLLSLQKTMSPLEKAVKFELCDIIASALKVGKIHIKAFTISRSENWNKFTAKHWNRLEAQIRVLPWLTVSNKGKLFLLWL